MNIAVSPMKKFALSLCLAAAVSAGVWLTLRREQNQIAAAYKMTTVVQTKKYLSSGKALTADMVEEVRMPEAYVPPGAFNKNPTLSTSKARRVSRPASDCPRENR